MERFNIKYEIIGKEDGRWIIQAFDRNNLPLGTKIEVNTPSEAWKIFMMLNGYSDMEPTEIIQKMKNMEDTLVIEDLELEKVS